MADRRIEGRHGITTLISDSYGQTILTGPPDPAEDPSRWHGQEWTDDEIMRETGLSQEQIDMGRAHLGLDEGRMVTTVSRFSWNNRYTRKTPASKVQQWVERVKSLRLK